MFNSIDADQYLLAIKRQVAKDQGPWRETICRRFAYYRFLEAERMLSAIRRMEPMRADATNPKGFDFDVFERVAAITRLLADASLLVAGSRTMSEIQMIDAEAMLRMHDELRGNHG